jgi:acetylornithine deacetylase/succinyl-diaminopimelate desuccinylase-like protein
MGARLLQASLIRRRRRLARLLLYAVPVLAVAAGWAAVTFLSDLGLDHGWRQTDYRRYEAVRLLQSYLRIDTSFPTGNEIPGAEFLARELVKDGVAAHVERLGHRNANVWAVLEGQDPRALVLHNHIDVDPISGLDQWDNPPFSGLIDLPFIYGRGAFDMKSLAIAQLMAVKELARDGRPPARSLVFLATGDEERESWHGTRWILRRHPELVKRFGVVLTEGGAVEATAIDDVKYWGTESVQKLFVEVTVCGDNRGALEALREDLTTFDLERGHPDRLPQPVLEMLRTYVATRQLPEIRLRFESALAWRGGFNRLPFNLRAMMRNELSAFPVVEDPGGGGYSMRLILQLLPWLPVDEAWASLLPEGLGGFSVAVDVPHEPIALAGLDHPIFEHVSQRVEAAYPRFVHGPLFIPWAATDARFFRAAGIPAYGFSPFVILTGDAAKITGPNERLVAPAFLAGVDLYHDVVVGWVR